MSRRDLELRAKKELEASGYLVERAVSKAIFTPKGFVARSFDFFNCFDLIAVRDYRVRFIQITSSNQDRNVNTRDFARSLSAHKKKINDLWPVGLIEPEIWHYMKSGRIWILNKWVRAGDKWFDVTDASESIINERSILNINGGKK